MLLRRSVLVCLLIIAFAAAPNVANAFWTDDGIPVCALPNNQSSSVMCSDGAGGAIIAWKDYRIADEFYVQHIDASGQALWGTGGKLVCSETGTRSFLGIVSDGAGGAIMSWYDLRWGNADIYVQHIDADGIFQLPANGLRICAESSDQSRPVITSDGDGGAIVAWDDRRNGSLNVDIYAQRINNGFIYWMPDGAAVCTAADTQQFPKITSDGAHGAIVVWQDQRGASPGNIYAQRISEWGVMEWTANGVLLCSAANSQDAIALTDDGAGGAIMIWRDYRISPVINVYAQRITAAGTVAWNLDGVSICDEHAPNAFPQIISDGEGGAFTVWHGAAEDPEGDIFAQRIDGTGNNYWQANGLPVGVIFEAQEKHRLVPDGEGGIIVAWTDNRYEYDIYAQRLDRDGNTLWTASGVAICTAVKTQNLESLISDGAGGALICWADWRSDSNYDLFAQQLDSKGRTGYLPPVIHSVEDVPGDQGGYVNLAWDATVYDYMSAEITSYSIWRAISTPAAQALLDKGATVITDPGALPPASTKLPQLRLSPIGGTDYYWEYLMYQNASRIEHYAKAVPTLFDCTPATEDDTHYFQIIAHTSDPDIFFVSDPDSGCSVDNLAPGMPLNVSGEQSVAPPGIRLTWAGSPESDFSYYNVYRDLSSGFIPGPGNLVYSPAVPEFFDGAWRWDSGYYYKISALDIHGNESEFASFSPDDLTGAEDEVSLATFLAQNYPNPFNPMTSIRFGLEDRMAVTLKIYDAAGRLVRTLVDETRDAGAYTEAWLGRDDGGRQVSSGVYFYKLNAGNFEQTNKMILLK